MNNFSPQRPRKQPSQTTPGLGTMCAQKMMQILKKCLNRNNNSIEEPEKSAAVAPVVASDTSHTMSHQRVRKQQQQQQQQRNTSCHRCRCTACIRPYNNYPFMGYPSTGYPGAGQPGSGYPAHSGYTQFNNPNTPLPTPPVS